MVVGSPRLNMSGLTKLPSKGAHGKLTVARQARSCSASSREQLAWLADILVFVSVTLARLLNQNWCREEILQPRAGPGAATQQHGSTECNGQAEPAWVMNAEVQTFATSQAPLWSDDQFSFLELIKPDKGQEQTGCCWQKVIALLYTS